LRRHRLQSSVSLRPSNELHHAPAHTSDGSIDALLKAITAATAASLIPGGRFAWNAFAFDHQIAARLDGQRQNVPVPHTIRYAVGDNRIDITLDDGATSSLWWATKNEWLGLLDVAGLDVAALYGGFDRKPVSDQSREYVFIAAPRG
jgi:hypothetical protein